MFLINKRLDSISEMDLQYLVSNKVAEGKSIEYKEELPGYSDGDKKEFLYDVSSFANASGGDLIYGIKETDGIASEISGMSMANTNDEILRLESIIQTGIEPRIPGIATRDIQIINRGAVILIRIQKSWAMPHMVKYGGVSRFYSRNSKGKYQLDVGEIRSAFAFSETAAEQIRNFRTERLSLIVAGERMNLDPHSPRIILHIVPLTAFDTGIRFDVSALAHSGLIPLAPIGGSISHYRQNFDGLISYADFDQTCYSYLQIFRNGCVEAVRSSYFRSDSPQRLIPKRFEGDLLEAMARFLSVQEKLGVDLPFYIMLSLIGVAGYTVGTDSTWGFRNHPIDRDALLIPEVELDNYHSDLSEVMKPIFDSVWNASGWERSMNYDENGIWIGKVK